jgi:predicted secreted acid phosphatase
MASNRTPSPDPPESADPKRRKRPLFSRLPFPRGGLAGTTALLALLLAPATPPLAEQPPLTLSQPANVGDAKIAATAYHASGAYERDLAAVAEAATAWIESRARQVDKPALVLDIDDTALTNWDVIVADDFGRVFDGPCDALPKGPCGWVAWDLRAEAPPIASTHALYEKARSLGVDVFFITGRDQTQRSATEKNLRGAGYGGYRGLYMTPVGQHFPSAADFKAPVRAAIESAGYTIIANMGDQPSDLAGGHAERTFLLPNPFYRIP